MAESRAGSAGTWGYRELVVWQKAVELAASVYRLTEAFPASERFSLVDQLNRAAVSVASNIAEGSKRNGPREFSHFLSIAHGSLAEVDTQLEIAVRVGYVARDSTTDLVELTDHLGRMLTRLRRRLAESGNENPRL